MYLFTATTVGREGVVGRRSSRTLRRPPFFVSLTAEGKPMSLRLRSGFALIAFAALQVVSPAYSIGKVKRHDTIIMKNGDRLTGEVKRLEQGIPYIQTDNFSGSV